MASARLDQRRGDRLRTGGSPIRAHPPEGGPAIAGNRTRPQLAPGFGWPPPGRRPMNGGNPAPARGGRGFGWAPPAPVKTEDPAPTRATKRGPRAPAKPRPQIPQVVRNRDI